MPVETVELFPTVTNDVEFVLPTDSVERVQHQLAWFWFMYAPMAKWAARGDEDRTRDQLEGLNRVLREAADLAGQQLPTPRDGEAFSTARALGDAMIGLHPALRSVGSTCRQRSQRGCDLTTKRTRSVVKGGCAD